MHQSFSPVFLALAFTAQVAIAQDNRPEHDDTFFAKPLVEHIYTADPSAHVFGDRLYIYPSHDIDTEKSKGSADDGAHFDMKDYHVLSMDKVGGETVDHGAALKLEDIPWAKQQLWAPDAAEKNGKYYLYFPAKDKDGVFRIGVAQSDKPEGPFKPQPTPMDGSFSIDPAVYRADNGDYYMYFGGIWGGQLERWAGGSYSQTGVVLSPTDTALAPKVVKLSEDMLSFEGEVQDVQLLDENGNPLLNGDNDRRFFEAAWLHKYQDTYYLSYSTGDTHKIVYATGDNPLGPFTYQGVVLEPVIGWTNHHSITKFQGKWYLFYHDCRLSEGKTHLRTVKMTELHHQPDGSILTVDTRSTE
ncbi:Xylosidase/arabinosidase [Rubripirellula obstinata]|uniref:Xylosidase/arabinosidase n=1 Tax=Rubripirellula obstinata TaxID=406547 RepID=A0A5B1CJC8_9BACT|nr:glycoside hydrolase family 43 protein [Rubripirellula obstinata]KAA1260035.1 Xylosidase/arabinosidase [Rubripirellula obstinata]